MGQVATTPLQKVEERGMRSFEACCESIVGNSQSVLHAYVKAAICVQMVRLYFYILFIYSGLAYHTPHPMCERMNTGTACFDQ
jgi:hypothetical protein